MKRFWDKVDKSGDCWLWTAGTNGQYGSFGRGTREQGKELAHRMAYELTHGSIPKGLFVRHTCDTPLCCNPAHLELGTHVDNMHDMHARGRSRGDKFTSEQCTQIKTIYRKDSITQRGLAEMFNCSVGLINKVVKQT